MLWLALLFVLGWFAVVSWVVCFGAWCWYGLLFGAWLLTAVACGFVLYVLVSLFDAVEVVCLFWLVAMLYWLLCCCWLGFVFCAVGGLLV